MQPSQETRVLAEFDGINWEVGLLRMRAWSVETSILASCKVGGGDRWGGGGASAVGTMNFNKTDGSGDVSSGKRIYQRHVLVSFLRKRHRNTRAVIHFAITHLATSDGKPGVGACHHY